MVARRLLPYAMRSNDDNDLPVHSLMLSLHDLGLRGLQRLLPIILVIACCENVHA